MRRRGERDKRGEETFNMMLHEHLLLLLHSPGEEGEGKNERERETHMAGGAELDGKSQVCQRADEA